MESVLAHTHSGLRWIFLILAIYTLIRNNAYTPDKKSIDIPLYTLILFGLQIFIGLILYFISNNVTFEAGFMKNAQHRFFTIEHAFGMLLAFIIMFLGYRKSRMQLMSKRNKTIKIHYAISLIVVIASIPWPFRGFGNGWF